MSFFEFFQQNVLLFGAAIAVFAALIVLEYRGWQTRGANLSTSGLSQQVNGGATLIDIRRAEDFKAGHIAGAKNLPFETLKKAPESVGDKDDNIVLYCYTLAYRYFARDQKRLSTAADESVFFYWSALCQCQSWQRICLVYFHCFSAGHRHGYYRPDCCVVSDEWGDQ